MIAAIVTGVIGSYAYRHYIKKMQDEGEAYFINVATERDYDRHHVPSFQNTDVHDILETYDRRMIPLRSNQDPFPVKSFTYITQPNWINKLVNHHKKTQGEYNPYILDYQRSRNFVRNHIHSNFTNGRNIHEMTPSMNGSTKYETHHLTHGNITKIY